MYHIFFRPADAKRSCGSSVAGRKSLRIVGLLDKNCSATICRGYFVGFLIPLRRQLSFIGLVSLLLLSGCGASRATYSPTPGTTPGTPNSGIQLVPIPTVV